MSDRQYTERVAVYLTKEQRRRLDAEAYRTRKALTELLRDLVDAIKEKQQRATAGGSVARCADSSRWTGARGL